MADASATLEQTTEAMAQAYKLAKEAFVSNLSGGTVSELLLVTAVAPSSVLLWAALQARALFFVHYSPISGLVDFLLNIAAILFAFTLYSSNPVTLNLALLVPAVFILLLLSAPRMRRDPKKPKPPAPTSQDSSWHSDALPPKPFVTTYRGTMMVTTCVAILAVDFPVFPRRFGKVEGWGTSIMDLGVGSFVFSAGLVGVRAILKALLNGKKSTVEQRLLAASKSSIPLLILGLIRLWSVKGLEYAEHVSEYGVHWNFFFTLALLPPFVAVCDAVFTIVPSYVALALIVGVGYEIALESTNLIKFMLTAPRVDLLSKNREGLFSLFGYLAIFLAGQATGYFVLPANGVNPSLGSNATNRKAMQQPEPKINNDRILRNLIVAAGLWSLLFVLLTDYTYGANLRVSRRLANLPYVVGVAAFNNFQLAMFYLIERLVFPPITLKRWQCSRLLAAFNRNGLALFLLANLLTGACNMALPTLSMGNGAAMAVLVTYMGLLSGVAVILDAYDVSIKLS